MIRDFHSDVQNFIANGFTSSVFRNMVPAGALAIMQKFLKQLDLATLKKARPDHYPWILDDLTQQLQQAMPEDARHWGIARKCLNLFFRDALYNFYLRTEFDLVKFEASLEIPLDSSVGRALRREPEGANLPQWKTVKGLMREDSAKFQAVAAEVAKREGTERIHLDIVYWRGAGEA